MDTGIGWFWLAAVVASAVGTGLVRHYAYQLHLLDLPEMRRAHRQPTPRGGGMAIAAVVLAGLSIQLWQQQLSAELGMALLGGGVLIAVIGILEDHRPLPRSLRLLVHITAAVWAMIWLPGPALGVPALATVWALLAHAMELFGLVWLINLYNFMDGIDGLAASEAVFVALAALVLLDQPSSLSIPLGLIVAASVGFLLWNWPPAMIFMGDSGSCFLGFMLGASALASVRQAVLPLGCWLILLGVFLIDASLTLVQRMLAGERWYEPHRSHAYQHAAQRWHSHAWVTLAVWGLNLGWLGPWAWLARLSPMRSPWLVLVAWLPLLVLARMLGAGCHQQ